MPECHALWEPQSLAPGEAHQTLGTHFCSNREFNMLPGVVLTASQGRLPDPSDCLRVPVCSLGAPQSCPVESLTCPEKLHGALPASALGVLPSHTLGIVHFLLGTPQCLGETQCMDFGFACSAPSPALGAPQCFPVGSQSCPVRLFGFLQGPAGGHGMATGCSPGLHSTHPCLPGTLPGAALGEPKKLALGAFSLVLGTPRCLRGVPLMAPEGAQRGLFPKPP
mmetsp:Transcript_12667/g.34550  ORF Transcript_12667/g.34550 Transcript_12667/m.34550 type:complete len:223 (-) Transcript_12667:1288-1956(-)